VGAVPGCPFHHSCAITRTQSSLSALLLGEIALEAGIPAGVLNVVPGPGNTVGAAIGLHQDVDALTFTGSTLVAKQLLGYAGRSNMKQLSLEAGGKSANVIFADVADVREAAEKAAFGAFYNQGEVCSATSRILVEHSIYDEFVSQITRAAADYEPGDPLHEDSGNGSLVSTEHADKVEAAIASARESGEILHGGERLAISGSTAYVRPTLVGALELDHPANRNEIFGPVATISVFDTEDEAIAKANGTDYGLAASLWTSDLSRAHRVSSRLRAGTVSVNTVDAIGVTTPFGGFKQSGFGRDLSIHAIDNYVGLKTTWIQHG
jgi:aldehyde dehydrogenase (NAD+)/gamma-glutamyl-gamma-aminobutyraldehyde dehydrogenase